MRRGVADEIGLTMKYFKKESDCLIGQLNYKMLQVKTMTIDDFGVIQVMFEQVPTMIYLFFIFTFTTIS